LGVEATRGGKEVASATAATVATVAAAPVATTAATKDDGGRGLLVAAGMHFGVGGRPFQQLYT
jgi:hypothetical protein